MGQGVGRIAGSRAARTFGFVVVVAALGGLALQAGAQTSTEGNDARTFKVAFYNIQSGKGEPALPGRPVLFIDGSNCTDRTQPMNGWGVGFVQQHLLKDLSDPGIVALGLVEAWPCATPSNVRELLGWKSHSTERNGVALVARHGFAGPEQWVQLDTSLNRNPADTMWVLRVPVCLDAGCSAAVDIFTTHWYAEKEQQAATIRASYDRQAVQTVQFLQRSAARPHILIGDLNTWDGTSVVCEQEPPNAGLDRLRDAGYTDAWPLLHGEAEGFTGMVNRGHCGSPKGYAYKRIDYVWAPPGLLPLAIDRFGIVPPGHPAPSDHYGLLAEFPWPEGAGADFDGTRAEADFDGNGTSDIGVYRPSTGTWFIRNQSSRQFGDAGDLPVPGDYDGDRAQDVAVYRPSSGVWYVRNQFSAQFGDAGDIPVPFDYNADGRWDLVVYRPSNGMWYVRGLGAVQFGDEGDLPVPADYDGDGITDIAVYRPSNGMWFVRNKFAVQFGEVGDIPVPGDYNGDRRVDVAVYRPSNAMWYARHQFGVQYGDAGDVPVPGDYNGDGTHDVAVYRPSTGTWFVRNQSRVQYGDVGDIPLLQVRSHR